MTITQRIILIVSGIILLIGSAMIAFSDGSSILDFIGFYVFILIPTLLFYFAFSSSSPPQNSKTTQKTKPVLDQIKTVTDTDTNVDPSIPDPNQILLVIKSVFPFDIFPEIIIVEEKSVSIIHKTFFFSGYTETISYNNLGSVTMSTGPLFASLRIIKKAPFTEIEIDRLWRKDAIKVKELTDALILRQGQQVKIPEGESTKKEIQRLFKIGHNDVITEELQK